MFQFQRVLKMTSFAISFKYLEIQTNVDHSIKIYHPSKVSALSFYEFFSNLN